MNTHYASMEEVPQLEREYTTAEVDSFVRELASVAATYSGSLGGSDSDDSPREGASEATRIAALIERLSQEQAAFSPVLDILPLNPGNFAEHGLTVPIQINDLLRRFQFYLVQIPITLIAEPRWAFRSLECRIAFNPEEPAQVRPVAYQIFPESAWQDIVRARQQLTIGLDENLQFKLAPDPALLHFIPPQLGSMEASVSAQAAGATQLVLGPFDFQVRRPKILSAGRGNVEVYWRLDGEEQLQREEPRLAVVLQVPKSVSRVDLVGVLKASQRFHAFTADVHHLLRYLRERARSFFEQGAPLTDGKVWSNVTAGL